MERKERGPRPARKGVVICHLLFGFSLFALNAIGCCSLGGPPDPLAQYIRSQGSTNPRRVPAPYKEGRLIVTGPQGPVSPGDRVECDVRRAGVEEAIGITIYVPIGATNFRSDPAPIPGGPPYIYPNVEGTGVLITYSYDAPDLSEGSDEMTLNDVVEFRTVVGDNDPNTGATSGTVLEYTLARPPDNALPGAGVADEARGASPADADITIWQVMRIIEYGDQELTSELCRDWIEPLAEGEGFVAVRLPLAASTYPTESVSLPLYAAATHPLAISVDIFAPASRAYSAPLLLRPEFMGYAASALPPADGELWVTLGVWEDAPAVPDGISAPAEGWALVADLYLDLSAQPDEGNGLVQPLYLCTVEEEPAFVDGYVSPECIACIGPQSLSLVDMASDWALRGNNTDSVDAGDVIEFSHLLRNLAPSPIQVEFAISSTLGVDWTVYAGDCANPGGRQPVTGPYALDRGREMCLWLVSQAIPHDTVSGYYNVILTAEDAAGAERWVGNQFWVEGVAPTATATATVTATPTATPAAGRTLVVPLVFRSLR